LKEKLIALTLILFLFCEGRSQANTDSAGDFAIRAFHLDLRIQVMKMPALKLFVQKIQKGGINTLIMEYEATFPFQKHPLIPNKYAYSKEEISSFVAYCNKLGVDVIPLQQSFGHVEYILRNYRYSLLREDKKDLSQVCPLQTLGDSILFRDLYSELASVHTSKYIHIGADETHLLGHCPRCSAKAEKEGISKLYIDYVKMLCNIIISLGKRPVMWADIALKYPQALQSLPKETIFVDWNYGWDMDRFGEHQKLIESGFEIWGAPALRSHPDNYFLTQWEKHFNNIREFIPLARQMGYKGMVMTSWSTSGGYSYLYESDNAFIDLYPIRHVYPITGFNILLAAYIQSLGESAPLKIEDFIINYGVNQYGFTKGQATKFSQALRTAPYEVSDGIVQSPSRISLESLTDSIIWASKELKALTPTKNKEEFEHYRLMADIRVQYLGFLNIEKKVNSESFSREEIPIVLKRLRLLLNNANPISQRFIELNQGSFYLPELKEENQLRNMKMQGLYDRLSKFKT
jgi:hexosaminidase